MVKISVIMPVYNVEDYLDDALNSILNQTIIDDIEVLMIDDGSSDDSRYIVEKYALDYDNFHAFHKSNEGSAIARNFAINHAKGDYIHFFDSDDYLLPDAYEKLYNLAVKNDDDFVVAKSLRFTRFNLRDDLLFNNAFKDFKNRDEISINIQDYPSLLWDTVIWDKLYKKDFIIKNNLKFPNEKLFYQDIPFSLKSYLLANFVFHGWRVRKRTESATQQSHEITNFENRLRILRIVLEILDEFTVSDEFLNQIYFKWLNHDLRIFLNKFDNFPSEYQMKFLDEINEILNLMPSNLKDDLNSYRHLLIEMALNRDIKNLVVLSDMEHEDKKAAYLYHLMNNGYTYPEIDEKYYQFINFDEDAIGEKLIAEVLEVTHDSNYLIIDFIEEINYYMGDNYREISAVVISDDSREFVVDVDSESRRIFIPLNIIKNNNHLKIKLKCVSDIFEKECFLKINKRHTLIFDDFDIDVGIGINRQLYLDSRFKNDLNIVIDEISFKDDEFNFTGRATDKFTNISMSNLVTFDELIYLVRLEDIGDEEYHYKISFSIPLKDINSNIIKKWEIKPACLFNTIELSNIQGFFQKKYCVQFKYSRNKIILYYDIFNTEDELTNYFNDNNKFKAENKELKRENRKLTRQNNKLSKNIDRLENKNQMLNDRIDEFKARKVIKAADKVQNFKNKF